MSDTYADLRALAEAAPNHRPWVWTAMTKGNVQRVLSEGDVLLIAETYENADMAATVAPYIAAANPARVLALLADLDAARRAVWASEEIDRRAGMLAGVQAERDALAAKIEAVRALHRQQTRITSGSSDPKHVPLSESVCRHCGGMSYPCATIRALDGAS